MLDVLQDRFRTSAEAADRGERLAEGADDQVDPFADPEVARRAATALAHRANGVSVVDEQSGVVATADLDDLGEGGDVPTH